MKVIYIILISLFILVLLGIFYVRKYSYYDVADDELIYLNQFNSTEKDYVYFTLNANIYSKKNDLVNAKYFSKKILSYRNTYNEKQFEKLFSCGNNYWEYKQKKLLNYSTSYERIGQIDSAIACLKIGLTNVEKSNFETDQRFFSLQIKKLGKENVVKEIKAGLENIQKQDCFMCCDYYYYFLEYKIGIDDITDKDYMNNKTIVIHKLLKEYNIEI